MRREGKLGDKSTSHTRHTGKCKKARCRLCHTAPLNKSMGKSKGESKMKQNDINSNYLMHDWRVCETSTPPQYAGRSRPKVKVGSPSSVWTSSLNCFADDYEVYADSGAANFDATEFEAPPKTLAELIPTRATRGPLVSRKKAATSVPVVVVVEAREAPLPADVGAMDLKSDGRTPCVSDSEALSETLCFGTIGAMGSYWKNNPSSQSCVALANYRPAGSSSEQVSDAMQDPNHDNFSASSDNDVQDSELLFLYNIQVPSDVSEAEEATAEPNGCSNACDLEGVMVQMSTTLDHQDVDSDFKKRDSDLDSDSDESWSDVADAEGSPTDEWCFLDVEESYIGEDKKISFRAVSH